MCVVSVLWTVVIIFNRNENSLLLNANPASNPTIQKVHQGDKKKRLPDVLIIGSAKCGTTALHRYLAIHPDIAATGDIEVNFFSKNVLFEKGLNWYRQQMPESEPWQLTLEKTPIYIRYPKRIKTFLPNAKFIWTVCDPFRRAVSLYLHRRFNKSKRYMKKDTFEEMIRMIWGKNGTHIFLEMVKDGTYSVLLEEWLKYFSMDSLFIVYGDRLKYNLVVQLQKLERFLGLRKYFKKSQFVLNKRGFSCLRNGTNAPSLVGDKGFQDHPKVYPKVEEEMRRYYQPYNEKFFVMTNRTFNWTNNVK